MSQQNDHLKYQFGALPDAGFKQFMAEKIIRNASESLINPSSLDLRANLASMQKIGCTFTPSVKYSSINETLKHFNASKISKTCDGYFMERDSVYVLEIEERIQLPSHFYARANPKSSTGRSCAHAQLLGDFVPQYDRLPFGWQGNLYVMVCTNEFDILFEGVESIPLNQLRLFCRDAGILTTEELRALAIEEKFLRNDHKNIDLIYGNIIADQQVILTIDLRDWGQEDCLGYVARTDTTKPLVWKTGANDWQDFFQLIPKVHDRRAFKLEANRFYILSSRESIRIPIKYACEMVSFDDTRGELRAHYAGFIDNGWGTKGHRPLTLEVRPFKPTMVYHGQPITSVVLHKMCAPVEKGYDDISTSNYVTQNTARLGKFFKSAA